MIVLAPNGKIKNSWFLVLDKENNIDEIVKLELNLISGNSIAKKFSIVAEVVLDISKTIPGFTDYFYNMTKEYVDSDYNSEIVLDNIDTLIDYAKKYVDYKNVDYSQFVDKTKVTKTSVLFGELDIKELFIASTALKVYSIFNVDEKMKLPNNMHRQCYDKIVKGCKELGVTDKMFQLIRSRIYRSSITDKYMWDLIKMSISDTPETYVMTVFNFLMVNLVSMLSIESNPVFYLVSIADYKVRWLMRGVYKEKIVYGEAFSGTDDIFGLSQSKESLHLFCCNDTVARCAKLGMEVLETEYNMDDDEDAFMAIRERLDSIKNITPAMKFFILPIISKVLDVPYKYLLTTPAKHLALVGIFMHHISKDILERKYPILSEFLISCPTEDKYVIAKSFYQLKNFDGVINSNEKIFGFDCKTFKYEILSSLCGILSTIKRSMVSIIDGKKLNKIAYNNLESETVEYYTDLYGGKLQPMIDEMKLKVDSYF